MFLPMCSTDLFHLTRPISTGIARLLVSASAGGHHEASRLGLAGLSETCRGFPVGGFRKAKTKQHNCTQPILRAS